jgi:hypothetical protein
VPTTSPVLLDFIEPIQIHRSVGQISEIASSLSRKNKSLVISANQNYNHATSSPRRGVGHRHQALGWDAVDAAASGAFCAGRSAVRVRRSRVVPAPWMLAPSSWSDPRVTVANSQFTGEITL